MSRKSNIGGVLLVASFAALAAGCVTETPYNLPQTLPAPGQPTYSTSPYYGYGSGYGSGYYGYGPSYGYYSDPMYYGRAAPYPYPYYYGYPVIVRCPDNNRDGRCDKPVKNDHDGDHDGNHDGHDRDRWQRDDNAKYHRDARGQVPLITPKTGQTRPQQPVARAPAQQNVAPRTQTAPAATRADDDASQRGPRRAPPREVDPRDPRWQLQR